MLDVRNGGGDGSDDGGVEGPEPRGEEEHGGGSARDFEPARGNVVVRHAVSQQVGERSERERAGAGAGQRSDEGAGGDVERDDHGPEGGRMGETNDTREES